MIHELPGLDSASTASRSRSPTIARHADRVVFPAARRPRSLHRADGPGPGKGRRAAAGSAGAEPLRGRRATRAASCATRSASTKPRRSFSASASPIVERASICSSRSASDPEWPRDDVAFVWVGTPRRRRVADSRGGARDHGGRRRRRFLLPGHGRGSRRVLRRRRRLPDDVARRSVPARGARMPSTRSSRSSGSRARAASSSCCSAAAAFWCRISTRRRWRTRHYACSTIQPRGATAGGDRQGDHRVASFVSSTTRATSCSSATSDARRVSVDRAELQLRATSAGAPAVDPGADLRSRTRSSSSTTARRTAAWSSRRRC